MIYLLYLMLAAAVVLISIKCADYVDLLDKKTNLSGAFIGGVILAAVTSLPELFTSLTAVVAVQNEGLVLGNILGSNVFNLTIFGGSILLAAKSFADSKVGKSHMITLICTMVVYALLTLAVVFGLECSFLNISVYTFAAFVIYLVSLKFMSGDESENDEEDESSLSVKQITVRFVLLSVLLVASSIAITYVTDEISVRLNLGSSLVGAVFLGVATSLPELSSSIALVRRKNFNAMIGNVCGSNMFNFAILFIADLCCRRSSLLDAMHYSAVDVDQASLMIIWGMISAGAGIVALISKRFEIKPRVVYMLCGAIMLASYFAFLVLSV